MQAPYYDRDGRPVSQEQWQQLGRQPGYSRIGYHDAVRHGQQVTVITFWSGIAGHGPDGPLIFCTCAGIRIPGGPRPAALASDASAGRPPGRRLPPLTGGQHGRKQHNAHREGGQERRKHPA